MGEHPVWLVLTAVCVGWYAVLTVYVAAKGALDIRAMLAKLRDSADAAR